MRDILFAKEKYGRSDYGKGLKTVVEFVSANPTGPLTIAHGRQAAIGDCLVRILKAAGFDTSAEYYLNDAGRQMRLLGGSVFARYSSEFGKARELPEDGYRGSYIFDLAKDLIKAKGDALLKLPVEDAEAQCTDYAKDTIMSWIKKDLETTRCHFDNFYSERTLYAENKVEEALNLLKDRGYIFESEGAVWFRSTDLGDDKDRVVKKSTGEYTYLAPDIAYHMTKYNRGFRKIVNLWGPDHHGYIPRLKAACQVLGYDADKIHVGIVQLSTLYRKGEPMKMSTVPESLLLTKNYTKKLVWTPRGFSLFCDVRKVIWILILKSRKKNLRKILFIIFNMRTRAFAALFKKRIVRFLIIRMLRF